MKELLNDLLKKTKDYLKLLKIYADNIWLFFRQEYKEIFLFTLFCAALSFAVSELLGIILPKLFCSTTGIYYLNQSNMLEAAKNPISFILVLIYVIAATHLSLFEISGLLHAFSMAQIGRDSNLTSMMKAGLRTLKKTLNPKNWGVILFLFVLLPITGVLTMSSTGLKMRIPYFILQGIEANPIWNRMYTIAMMILLVIELVYLFSINLYVLRDISFTKACRESRRLGKKHYGTTILTLVAVTLVLNFVINSISSIIPMNINEFISLFRRNVSITSRSNALGVYVFVLRSIIKSLVAPAVNNAALTVLFFAYLEEQNKLGSLAPSTFVSEKPDPEFRRRLRYICAAFVVGFLVFSAVHYRYLVEPVDTPIVCAHRGDNFNAPENTLESVELALAEQLDWVEVDVFEALDGTIVCSHDENLLRVTGHDVKVTEQTFEELQQYPMLDSLPGNYENVTVPKLEDVMKAVKKAGATLQIELKTNGHDKNLEEEVLRLINELDMRDQVIVISLKSNTIKAMKALDPDIRTAVCAFVAWEDFKKVPYTDYLSMNDSEITPDLVHKLHKAGMKVLCWTVDSEDVVQYLVSCDVDVIGTNDPLTIVNACEKADKKGGLARVFHLVMNRVADMQR